MPNLLIDVTANPTAPTADQTINYRIRYRCASVTEHCTDAYIELTLPDDVDIQLPAPTGNITNVTRTGQMVRIDLASAPTPGVPTGALAAGSSGIIRVGFTFPCLPAGDVQSPAAGTTVQLQSAPTFYASTISATAAMPSPVTVPVFETCYEELPPGPPSTFAKRHNGGHAVTKYGLAHFLFDLPTTASPFSVTDSPPPGLGLAYVDGNADMNSFDVWCDCGNGFFQFVDNHSNSSNDLINYLNNQVTLGNQNNLLDINGSPTGCRVEAWALAPDGVSPRYAFANANEVRMDFPPSMSGKSVFMHWAYDPDLPPCTIVTNCGELSTGPTACIESVYVGEKPLLTFVTMDQFADAAGGNLGQTTVSSNLDPASTSTFDAAIRNLLNGTKHPMDVIMRIRARTSFILQNGVEVPENVFEILLPEGFDYITDGPQPNVWGGSTRVGFGESLTQECYDLSVLERTIDPATGRVRLKLSINCSLLGGTRREWGMAFTVRYVGTEELDPNNRPVFDYKFYMQDGSDYVIGVDPSNYQTNNCSITETTGNYTLAAFTDVDAIVGYKDVRGALDADYSRYPAYGFTTDEGTGEYLIEIANTSFDGLKQINFVDILPHIGDNSLIGGFSRDSDWSMELAGAVTVERVDVPTQTTIPENANLVGGMQYTSSYDACYLDAMAAVRANGTAGPVGCSGGFSSATPAEGARGFSFLWQNDANPLAFGEVLRVRVNVRQLTGEADASNNETAWNSFAFTAVETDDDEFLSTEPIKVGLRMIDASNTAAIGDYVWFDENYNGQQDAGELPFAGVQVNLYDAAGNPVTEFVNINGVSTNVPVSTLTDANGFYVFRGLSPNTDYYVRLETQSDFDGQLAGYELTLANEAGVSDESDSDAQSGTLAGSGATPYPQILAPTMGAGSETMTYDFGFVKFGSVCGYVFTDTDEEGDQDSSEPAVNNVTVRLFDAQTGLQVGSDATTDADGEYQFDNIPSGTYYVEFLFPAGTVATAKDVGPSDADDSDINSNGRSDNFTIAPCDFKCFDLGLINPPSNPASLAGTVWDEIGTKNGSFEALETGIPDVRVQLLDASGFVLNTTTTDANGDYLFENLTPGTTYQIAFVPPSLDVDFTTAGPDMDADPTTGITTSSYTPTANQAITDVDAGLCGLYSIGNLVFIDANDSGQLNPGELPVAGVSVYLFDNSNTEIASTTTDGNGRYLFTQLTEGTYRVEIDVPSSYRSSTDISSTTNPNQTDSDDNGIGTADTGRISSSPIVINAANVGSAGAPNWTETDRDEFIRNTDDPVSNPKAFYTVDFGLYFVNALQPPGDCTCNDYLYLNDTDGANLVHKFEIDPSNGAVTEIGSPWLPTGNINDPHGLAVDLNGFLYIGQPGSRLNIGTTDFAFDGTDSEIFKLNCEGTILDPDFVALRPWSANFSSANGYMYVPNSADDLIDAYELCMGTYVGSMQVNGGADSFNWGFYIENNTWYYPDAVTGNLYSGSTDISLYTNPATNSGSMLFNLGFTPTFQSDIPMGLTRDTLGNYFLVRNDISGGNSAMEIRKYDASGTFINAVNDSNNSINSGNGQQGFYGGRGIVYSKQSGYLYVSSLVNCITVFDTDLVEQTTLNIGNPTGSRPKGLSINTECCPNTNLNLSETICSTGNGERIFLQDVFDCGDGTVCEGQWSVQTPNANQGFNPCDLSITVNGAGCGTYVLEKTTAASGNQQCGPFTITLEICTEIPAATLTSTPGTCNGSTPNNDALINLTATVGDEANYSIGATYSGAAYGDVSNTDISSGSGTFTALMHNTQYTVRVFNGNNNCFTDQVITTADITCALPTFSLGNRVFFDDDINGIQNGSEGGIDGITLQLLNADGSVFDSDDMTPGVQMLSVTTVNGGYYRFDEVPEGSYIVEVSASNFGSGGILETYASSDGAAQEGNPNADGDLNDNGLDTPVAGAIRSGIITLSGVEPTGESEPSSYGAGSFTGTAAADTESNLTVDFGFYRQRDRPDYDDPTKNPCPDEPCHFLSTNIYFGSGVTGDPNSTGTSSADTDADDGLLLGANVNFSPGGSINLPVVIYNQSGNNAYFRMWIDWNGNGDFTDAGDQVADELLLSAVYNGTFTVYQQVNIPVNAVQNQELAIRMRLSTDNANTSDACGNGNCAADGEIEDYLMRINCPANNCVLPGVTLTRN